jgi:hypothetical protein
MSKLYESAVPGVPLFPTWKPAGFNNPAEEPLGDGTAAGLSA